MTDTPTTFSASLARPRFHLPALSGDEILCLQMLLVAAESQHRQQGNTFLANELQDLSRKLSDAKEIPHG